MTDSVEEMSQKISGSSEDASIARKALEPLFDQLDEFIDPLKDGVEAVKDVAESLGIDFG